MHQDPIQQDTLLARSIKRCWPPILARAGFLAPSRSPRAPLGLCVPMLLAALACLVPLVPFAPLGAGTAWAQAMGAEPPVQVPGFWDPRRRPERPDLNRVVVIRFLTEIDYPPFNFAGPDGNPQGFNVDLARMMCEELKVACTIQMRKFETLVTALNANQGDAAIASIATTPEMRTNVAFTHPSYRTPPRFLTIPA